jgi:EAL domain-containing protein (putative c-di-GMP-specific phosphodiesterase class I)
VRWQHPERGLLTPRDFIGLAEETGIIVELGSRVLAEACHQLRTWREAYPELDLTVAVNLSGRQVRDAALVDDVAAVLAATGLEGHCLTLEVTETTLLGDTAAAGECLEALKRLGVRVAMDDFGTGYSSLSYLRSLPIDVLKVDKGFIDGVADDPEAIGLVEAIIRMAKTLNLETIAEGVETEGQLRRLRRLGASSVQGFYFSPPLPVDAVADFLQRQISVPAYARRRASGSPIVVAR